MLGAEGPEERFPVQPGAPGPASGGGEARVQEVRGIGQADKAAWEGAPGRGLSMCRDPQYKGTYGFWKLCGLLGRAGRAREPSVQSQGELCVTVRTHDLDLMEDSQCGE